MLELLTRKKTDSEPSESERIAANIAAAEAAIERATTEIPKLQAEDAEVEGRVGEMSGEQIAEGDSRHADAIASANARRRAIAVEIEEIRAAASLASVGLAAAHRHQDRAKMREARERANATRAALIESLPRAIPLLREIMELDAELTRLAIDEWRAFDDEMRLGEQFKIDAPPASNIRHPLGIAGIPGASGYVLDDGLALLLRHLPGKDARDEAMKNVVTRIELVIEQARAANERA